MPVKLHGLLAQFDSADALVEACRSARGAGYKWLEAFAPYPLPEASRALGFTRNGVAFLTLMGGILGGCSGYFMLYWINSIAYRWNVGGKPPTSWPMWVPITFELTILTAAFSAFFGLLVLCRLPRYHHPLFGTPLFARATSDGFYLFVGSQDPKFQLADTRSFLASLRATGIEEVNDER